MPFDLIRNLLDDYVAAGMLNQEQKKLWESIFEQMEKTLTSQEFRNLIEEARSEFVSQVRQSEDGDPTPEVLQHLIEKITVQVRLDPSLREHLRPFEATGVVKHTPGKETVRINAISLLPKIIMRIGYFLPEEAQDWGRHLLEQSQEVWKKLGEDADLLLKRAVSICQQIDNYQKSIGLIESWDSSELYDSGSKIYKNNSQAVFVFSTTSGLVVPSEYNPKKYSNKGEPIKNPGRIRYFDALLNSETQLKRFYQWNRYSTAKRLYENCSSRGRDFIKKASIEILTRALQKPNFEITEADFGNGGDVLEKTKKLLTLTSATGVGISERKDELRKITHIMYNVDTEKDDYDQFIKRFLPKIEPKVEMKWDDKFLSPGASQYSIPAILYYQIYKQEVRHIVKGWSDPPMDRDSANKLAEDTFERLYQEGQHIVTNGLSEEDFRVR